MQSVIRTSERRKGDEKKRAEALRASAINKNLGWAFMGSVLLSVFVLTNMVLLHSFIEQPGFESGEAGHGPLLEAMLRRRRGKGKGKAAPAPAPARTAKNGGAAEWREMKAAATAAYADGALTPKSTEASLDVPSPDRSNSTQQSAGSKGEGEVVNVGPEVAQSPPEPAADIPPDEGTAPDALSV